MMVSGRSRALLVCVLVIQLLIGRSSAQDDIFVTGTGQVKTCGFNLLARLVVSNTCKGCSRTYNEALGWAFQLLNAGLNCGCGNICTVAGYHLFTLCQESIYGNYNWGRKRRDIGSDGSQINPLIEQSVLAMLNNQSFPASVSAKTLVEELRQAEEKLTKLNLINVGKAADGLVSEVQAGQVHTTRQYTSSSALNKIIDTYLRRRRRRQIATPTCTIDWYDIPMNNQCCNSANGCSSLQMREYC